MNRSFSIGILILCFSFSAVNFGLADEVMQVSPIIVQPYEVQELTQQMLNRDRLNRDEEIEIQNLIEENNKLIQETLARQQDEGLVKINQTMLNYRNSLFSRDQARILANGQRWGNSRYGDLIALTEDADAMTVDHELVGKNDLLAQKYQMLTELKDEMIALNEKLKGQGDTLNQKDRIIESYKEIAQQQQEKIRMIVGRLDEMDHKISRFDEIIAQKDRQIAQLKDDLAMAQREASQTENQRAKYLKLQAEILFLKGQIQQQVSGVGKDEIIKKQKDQITILKAYFKNQNDFYARIETELARKQGQVDLLKSELESKIAQEKNQSVVYADVARLEALKNKIHQQALDLKTRDESIRWLNQVLAATKNKAEYYKLTSERDRLSMQQVQLEVRGLKADFARNLQDYNQFENAIFSLKNQVSQLGLQLSQKQSQVDLLRSELEAKTAEIQAIHRDQANDDRLKLAHQLVDLQQQEEALLYEKSRLTLRTFTLLDRHVSAFENRIKVMLANHQLQDADLRNSVEELRNELRQKEQQEELLDTELRNKIAQEKNQGVLEYMMHDLKVQLQDKEDQVTALKAEIQSGQEAQSQADTLRQQLADEQNKVDLLKQELDSKTSQSDQMASLMSDYQKKLESKDNAYDQQLQQVLFFKNNQARMEAQISDLSARLQEKEARVVKIEKDMYDLQESAAAKDREMQAKDLDLSMVQQKAMDDKINGYQQKINGLQAINDQQAQEVTSLRGQLALVRQELAGMPSSDEINFLRAGLQKATLQLKQKDEMLLQIKVNADEYEKEFNGQVREFQSLKEQLQSAYDQIHQKDEDLKSKDLEVVRLKESFTVREGDLQDQIRVLTQKLDAAQKQPQAQTPNADVEALKAQLKQKDAMLLEVKANADEYAKEFKEQSKEFRSLKEQLQNAYDEIDRKKEDLKYKDMAIARLKEQRSIQKLPGNSYSNNVGDLQSQLRSANLQVKDLQSQLDQLKTLSNNRLQEKLKQALDEIDQQGQVINELVEKLHEAGQSVDLSKDFAKQ